MPENVYEMVFSQFIEKAASKSHTPGGGNVSAAVGTLAASMVCMVGNLTVSNKRYAEYHEQAQVQVDKLNALIEKFKKFTSDDMEAFDQYMAVFKMPKETDEDKKARPRPWKRPPRRRPGSPGNLPDLPRSSERGGRIVQIRQQDGHQRRRRGSLCGRGGHAGLHAQRGHQSAVLKDKAFAEKAAQQRAQLFAAAEDLKMKALVRVKEAMGY